MSIPNFILIDDMWMFLNKYFNLPKHVTDLTIRLELGEVVKCDCTYNLTWKDTEKVKDVKCTKTLAETIASINKGLLETRKLLERIKHNTTK